MLIAEHIAYTARFTRRSHNFVAYGDSRSCADLGIPEPRSYDIYFVVSTPEVLSLHPIISTLFGFGVEVDRYLMRSLEDK